MSKERKGKDFNQKIDEAAQRIEEDLKDLIEYINDDVVPAVREHSSKGLKIASEKLREFADYLDEHPKK